MSQAKVYTVRLQALDGVWEVGGVDRKRGIVPNVKSMAADRWGPSAASIELRRDPRAIWPDLAAFTPVEIERNGRIVWSGSISDTPSRGGSDRMMSLQCKGKQFHLDDDLYQRAYVHTRVSDWRDARTFLAAELGEARAFAAGQVSSDNGVVQLAFPMNTSDIPNAAYCGVILDLGPNSLAASASIDYETSNNHAAVELYVRGVSQPTSVGWAVNDVVATDIMSLGATGSARDTFSTPSRYVFIFLYNNNGGPLTPTEDYWVKLTGVRVFTDDAYRSTDASVLKASTVIGDALDRATILLDDDRAGIEATTFDIHDFVLDGPKTPREVWGAVNAYHDWVTQIDVRGRPVFKAKPSIPMFEVGAWSALEPEDQSANSGEEIYNRVIVTGTQNDGSPLWVDRRAGEQDTVILTSPGSPSPDNATFATNTASWTATGTAAVTRDTANFDSAPASGQLTGGLPAGSVTETFSGTFRRGVTYVLRMAFRMNIGVTVDLTFGVTGDAATASFAHPSGLGFWVTTTISWTPSEDRTGVTLTIDQIGLDTVWVDTLVLFTSTPTLVDRRGFTRAKELPVQAAMPEEAAAVIGDLWLDAHRTTPYKGTFRVQGDQAIRDPATGAYIELEELLLHTMELVRDTAAIDPDTGGVGRDGRIAEVTYTPETDEAIVTLDNSRSSYEALLARFDLINGAGR